MFWEEQVSFSSFGQAKVVLTRPSISSEPGFARHWARLALKYGQIEGLSLLSLRTSERELADAYRYHVLRTTRESLHAAARSVAQSFLSNGQVARDYSDQSAQGLLDLQPQLTEWDLPGIEARLDESPDLVKQELQRHPVLSHRTNQFAFTVVDADGNYRIHQQGVVRVNGLDCLSRANIVQGYLSQFALFSFFVRAASAAPEGTAGFNSAFLPYASPSHPIFTTLNRLWAQNGDALSNVLTDSSATPSSSSSTSSSNPTTVSNAPATISRKSGWGGFLSSVVKSMSRTYQTFQGGVRPPAQAVGEETLLGLTPAQQRQQRREQREQFGITTTPPVRLVQAHGYAVEDQLWGRMSARQSEFSTTVSLNILAGTFNAGASVPSMSAGWGDQVAEWLKPDPAMEPPGLVVLGFQELVELNASQVLTADDSQRRQWERVILLTLERTYDAGENGYHVVRSEQLVGTAIVVIARASLIPHIHGIEADTKKTGFKGLGGNKGGVAVRLTLHQTNFCFVVAHLAAGQSATADRATDYQAINSGLEFNHGWTINAHDHALWMGDLNYRIDMAGEQVRTLINQGSLEALHPYDQLLSARQAGQVFSNLTEGKLNFNPTYKYDVGKDVYDTSEKMRIPAWTDRIMFSPGDDWDLHVYTRANKLRVSDHRPVCAVFRTRLLQIDHRKRQGLYLEQLKELAPSQYQSFLASRSLLQSVSPTLSTLPPTDRKVPPPPPSDEEQHWWPALLGLSLNADTAQEIKENGGTDRIVPSATASSDGSSKGGADIQLVQSPAPESPDASSKGATMDQIVQSPAPTAPTDASSSKPKSDDNSSSKSSKGEARGSILSVTTSDLSTPTQDQQPCEPLPLSSNHHVHD